MEKKKKVLFFIRGGVGGSQRIAVLMAKLLPKEEFEPKIIVMQREIGEIRNIIPEDIPVRLLYLRKIWDFTPFRIASLLREERPYAVFGSMRFISIHILCGIKLSRLNIKCVVRNDNMMKRVQKYVKVAMRYTYPWADKIILQSQEMLDEFAAYLPKLSDRMVAITNPIDKKNIENCLKDAQSPFQDGCVNYVMTGRIFPSKGIDTLVSAFAKVKQRVKNARLYIVAGVQDEEYNTQIQQQVKDLELEKDIVFTGYQSNPFVYVKYADCFVLSSRREGLPNVVLEALYLQTPVVATRSVPIVDRLVEKDRGYVVDVDDVEALADSMAKAVEMKIKEPYNIDTEKEIIQLFREL